MPSGSNGAQHHAGVSLRSGPSPGELSVQYCNIVKVLGRLTRTSDNFED
jgi:hypothetical protein